VLAAARRLFAAYGFELTSIRAIAAESGVNQGLVMTYFGGKEALFMEIVGRFEISDSALAGGIEGMGSRLARAYVQRWENMAADDPWPALARSALSHEPSHRLLRRALEQQQIAPLRKLLGDTQEARARIAMVQTLIAGMIMDRYLYALEPARSMPAEQYETALASCLQYALTGSVTPSEPKARRS
jgi:AcrR family transcriptional regulator